MGASLIRWLTNSEVSHVDLVVPRAIALRYTKQPLQSREGLLGSRLDGGVQLRPSDYARFTKVVRVGALVPDMDAAYAYAFSQIGKPYSKQAIVDMFLHRHRPVPMNPSRWFCSELNYMIYKTGGTELLRTDFPDIVTPEEEMLSPDWTPLSASPLESLFAPTEGK